MCTFSLLYAYIGKNIYLASTFIHASDVHSFLCGTCSSAYKMCVYSAHNVRMICLDLVGADMKLDIEEFIDEKRN